MPNRATPLIVFALLTGVPVHAGAPAEDLWEAARKGDARTVAVLLAQGAKVNAKTGYGATALWFAAYKGHLDVVKVLVKHKADLDARDRVWGETPLTLAVDGGHVEMVKVLLGAGARGADAALLVAVSRGRTDLARAVLGQAKVKPESLGAALMIAPAKRPELTTLLQKAGARPLQPAASPRPKTLEIYAGAYESPNGMPFRVTLEKGFLVARSAYGGPFVLRLAKGTTFRPLGYEDVAVRFERQRGQVAKLTFQRGTAGYVFERSPVRKAAGPGPRTVEEGSAVVAVPRNWPSFRGPHASGVADGQHPPGAWDAKKGKNVRWKTPIPGLGHSSPIAWGDRVFVTTAVSGQATTEFKPGLYGAGTSAKDVTKHRFRVYCLDRRTGKVIWDRTACEGVPKVKRHIKSSHANPTPATDGKHVVVSFASEGLYGYDFAGKLLWKQDLGVVDVGAFNDPDLQWGAASSPIIYRGLAIMQCDRQKNSYIAAFDVRTGRPAWRTPRDEIPSWSTPTIYEGTARAELIANGTNYIRGYDPRTGKELWRLARNSQITVPAPVTGHGLIFVTSGYHPIQPIYAIWPGARGDISLHKGEESNKHVAWSKLRGGPYMPTPVVYGPYLYTCSNSGIVTCYHARTGKQIYKERLGAGAYSASPVAADGKLYFTSEEGEVRVVKAGPEFALLAINPMGDPCMATPAISDGMIFVRTQHFVYGIGIAR
jgi:outer membrane protein assembly factor BamB